MKFRHLMLGALSLLASMTASAAALVDAGAFYLLYDETTALGNPSLIPGAGGEVTLSWSLGDAVNYLNVGPSATPPGPKVVTLPSYGIIGKPGFQLHGAVTGFIGDIVYADVFGNQTGIGMIGNMVVDSNASIINVLFDKTPLVSVPNLLEVGTFSFSQTAPVGNFTVLAFQGALFLGSTGTVLGTDPANGLSLAAIQSRAENVFKVSFFASPVPVPPAAWLFATGVVGLAVRRRSKV